MPAYQFAFLTVFKYFAYITFERIIRLNHDFLKTLTNFET